MRTTDVQRTTEQAVRRRRRSQWAVHALAAGLAIAALGAGTGAYADPIRFDNPAGPGHYEWGAIPNEGDEVILSILHAADDQYAELGDSGAFRQRHWPTCTNVRRAGPDGEGFQFLSNPQDNASYLPPVDFETPIPTAGMTGFGHGAIIYWLGDEGYLFDGLPTILPEGEETYLGVRFGEVDDTDVFQYGWIGVVRTGMFLDAFAWGYETDPGVPILQPGSPSRGRWRHWRSAPRPLWPVAAGGSARRSTEPSDTGSHAAAMVTAARRTCDSLTAGCLPETTAFGMIARFTGLLHTPSARRQGTPVG